MRHLFLAAIMMAGALLAITTMATLLEDRARAANTHVHATWLIPQVANQRPSLTR